MPSTAAQTDHEVLELEVSERIATIWLNRPEAANSINLAVARELKRIAYDLAGRSDVGVVVLRGRGRQFCAGGDIGMFAENLEVMDRFIKDVISDFHDALLAFRQLEQPVVAVVHGAVAGGGLSLALGCDFIIAEENTKFATAYRKLGASTDGGMTHLLSRLLGQRKTLELLLMGEIFLAPQALELGLINRVVGQADLDAEVAAFCDVLARNAPAANGAIKRLVYSAPTATFEEQLSREMQGFSAVAATDDFKEGVRAFIERRMPGFSN